MNWFSGLLTGLSQDRAPSLQVRGLKVLTLAFLSLGQLGWGLHWVKGATVIVALLAELPVFATRRSWKGMRNAASL